MVTSWGCINTNSATILDKTVEKTAYLGGIFSKLRSRPIEYSVRFLWKYVPYIRETIILPIFVPPHKLN